MKKMSKSPTWENRDAVPRANWKNTRYTFRESKSADSPKQGGGHFCRRPTPTPQAFGGSVYTDGKMPPPAGPPRVRSRKKERQWGNPRARLVNCGKRLLQTYLCLKGLSLFRRSTVKVFAAYLF